jgi:hypothetical protein
MVQIKKRGCPVDLLMDTGSTNSVVTKPVSPLSQRHTNIAGPQEIRLSTPSLYLENAILESMKFLHLPNCTVALMGRDLCKLRPQVTFDFDSMVALKLRGPEVKILTLTIV